MRRGIEHCEVSYLRLTPSWVRGDLRVGCDSRQQFTLDDEACRFLPQFEDRVLRWPVIVPLWAWGGSLSFRRKALSMVSAAVLLPIPLAGSLAVSTPALAGEQGCPAEGENPIYTFTNISRSTRPTNIYSAYITGPGTITYSESKTANVEATASATVEAEAGVVFAKASTSIGVSVTAGRSWTAGFSYTLEVSAGQRRRMRLFQESRTFTVKKQTWNVLQCKFLTNYSGQNANAPRSARVDEWKLES